MKKKILKTITFLGIFFVCFLYLQAVFIPKWETDYLWEPITNMVDGFYAEPEDTVDVIYLGSSNAFYDINPLVIFEKYGMTGYVFGSGEQRIAGSYYYLQEALKRQSPKVVVLETLSLFKTGYVSEEQNRKSYDYMPLSINKIKSIRANVDDDEGLLSYIFPIARYHSRFSELTTRDFTYPFVSKEYFLKGYAYANVSVEGLPEFDMDKIRHEGIVVDEVAKEYLEKIQQLCSENQIQLVLIKTPNIEWGIYEHNLTTDLAKNMNIPFYDYNIFYKDLGIDESYCFIDGAHLNSKGAILLSEHLGGIVVEYFEELPAHSKKVEENYMLAIDRFKKMN